MHGMRLFHYFLRNDHQHSIGCQFRADFVVVVVCFWQSFVVCSWQVVKQTAVFWLFFTGAGGQRAANPANNERNRRFYQR